MLVRHWMSTNVVSLEVTDTMQQAINICVENHISMLPILEDGKLVGIVTDRDLKRASPSDAVLLDMQQIVYHLSKLQVGAIMSRYPITIPPDYTIEEATEVLLQNNISGAPVVDEQGNLLGIITKNDLFKAIISLTGLSKRGVQLGFLLDDKPGSIKEVTDIIRRHNARLVSILSSYDKAPVGYRHVYIRAFNVNRDQIHQLIEELKTKAKLLYVVDHKENIREIYTE
jgi:acetoin utilization protein AcuB